MQRVARLRARAPHLNVPADDELLAARWGGKPLAPGLVAVERRYPLWHRQGMVSLNCLQQLRGISHACLRAGELPDPADLVFLDTETTGLAGGTGTLAFLVGLGRLDGPVLAVSQWVLTRFAGETALLDLLAERIPADATLVSYNGKSFDLPLLASRARLHRRASEWWAARHIDLLHALRRRYGQQLPDCRLATAEARLLRFERCDDLPGAEAPRAWRQLLRGDMTALDGVLRHNRDDIVSMAALLPRLARLEPETCQA